MKVDIKSLFVVWVVAILEIAVGAGVRWHAGGNPSVHASLKVDEADTTIVAYNHAACTPAMTTVNFGTILQGTDAVPKTTCVRNEGTVPVRIVMTGATGLPSAVTLVNDPQPARDGVPVNAVEAFTVRLHAEKNAALGDVTSITIDFSAE